MPAGFDIPAPPGGSRSIPRPDGLCSPSSRCWICPRVSSQLDVPREASESDTQATAAWVSWQQRQEDLGALFSDVADSSSGRVTSPLGLGVVVITLTLHELSDDVHGLA